MTHWPLRHERNQETSSPHTGRYRLIGYTDELHSNYVEPALTAITHQTYKMGEECCNLLLKQIKKREKPRQIVVPNPFIDTGDFG